MNLREQWEGFKTFALKGNLVDLAVAVVIGGAFGKVVDSLVKDVLMPIISYVSPGQGGGYHNWHIGRVRVGPFLSELVNFLIIAVALYIVIAKVLGTIERYAVPPKPGEPTTKECPLCLSSIPYKASKCAHCTADLPAD